MNISDILNDFLLENAVVNYDNIYNDVFPDEVENCLISRYDPSQANETEYIDGSAIGVQVLSFYCRDKNASTCREVLNSIVREVDGLSCTIQNGLEINFSVVNLPQFISVDNKQCTIYMLTIKCNYIRKGE